MESTSVVAWGWGQGGGGDRDYKEASGSFWEGWRHSLLDYSDGFSDV